MDYGVPVADICSEINQKEINIEKILKILESNNSSLMLYVEFSCDVISSYFLILDHFVFMLGMTSLPLV